MTTYVEPQGAQIGDTVKDMIGFVFVAGEIVGIDTQGPAILVRWHDSRAMDVYSIDSPVWSCFAIVRPGAPVDVVALNDKNAVRSDPPPLCIGLDGSMSVGGQSVVDVVRDDAWLLPWSKPDGA